MNVCVSDGWPPGWPLGWPSPVCPRVRCEMSGLIVPRLHRASPLHGLHSLQLQQPTLLPPSRPAPPRPAPPRPAPAAQQPYDDVGGIRTALGCAALL